MGVQPPKITEEEISKYFCTTNHFQTVSSPIANHLEKVEATLTGEIPTDRAKVFDLKLPFSNWPMLQKYQR